MKPVFTEVNIDTAEIIRKAGSNCLKASFEIINKTARSMTLSAYYAHVFNYGHHCVYGKRGKHRKGQYVPKTLKGRFSQVQISRAIREIENVVPKDGWTVRDLLIHLKSR